MAAREIGASLPESKTLAQQSPARPRGAAPVGVALLPGGLRQVPAVHSEKGPPGGAATAGVLGRDDTMTPVRP